MESVVERLKGIENSNHKIPVVFQWVRQGIIRNNKQFREAIIYLKENGYLNQN